MGSNPAGGFRFPLVDFPYESRGCGPQIRAGVGQKKKNISLGEREFRGNKGNTLLP